MASKSFIRGLLDDPEDPQLPQYDPYAGMMTAKQAALLAAGLAPGAGVADAAGLMPRAEGGFNPSFGENVGQGNFVDAGMQALGAAGDAAYALGPIGGLLGTGAKGLAGLYALRKAANMVSPEIRAALDPAVTSANFSKPGVRAAKNLSRAEIAAEKKARIAAAIERSQVEAAGVAPELSPVPAEPVKSKAAKRNQQKDSVADVYSNVDDYDAARKMAERGAHLKQDKMGVYVGAPEGIDSPGRLGAMRRAVDQKVEAGAFNADWYDRARGGYSQAAGYDPDIHGYGHNGGPEARMASLFSRGGAVYSPQAAPSYETNGFLKQHNAKVVLGQDVAPKTGTQAKNVAGAYTPNAYTGGFDIDPSKVKLGKKTGPYADAKDPTIPDGSLYKTANDIWHGRVFGYTNTDGTHFDRAFTPQEHGFLTGENILASERANKNQIPVGVGHNSGEYPWTPRRMQAATWGAEREAQAIADQTYAQKKYEQDFANWQAAKAAGEKGLTKPSAPAMRTPEEIRDYAKYGIDTSFANHPANATYEYVTGENTNHLAGLNRADESVRQAYTDRLANLYGSRDPYYEAMQMFQLPQLRTMGEYQNSLGELERNPGITARPLAEVENSTYINSKNKEARGGPQIGPAAKTALQDIEFIRSINNAQEAGAAHKFTPANSSSKPFEITGARYEGSPESLVAAKSALESQGLNVVNVGDGLHVGLFPDENGKIMLGGVEADGRHIQNAIKTAEKTNKNAFKSLKGTFGRFESFYEPVPWSNQEGVVTNALIDRMNNSQIHNLPQRLDNSRLPGLLSQQNAIDRETAAVYNLPENQRIYKLRGLLADPKVGYSNLEAYVKKYGTAGLPALAVSPYLHGLLSQPSSQTEEYQAAGL
jgi:hypothetical protein